MPRQSEGKGSTGQRRVDRGVGLVRIMTAGCLGCESWRPMPTDSQSHGLAGQEGRRLSCAPVVAVVQAADLWNRDDVAERWWCGRPWMWRVLRQRVMRPRLVVVRQVPTQDARQFGFIHDDHRSRHSRRMEPMRRSAYAFCHGERGAVRSACMPIPLAVEASATNTWSRS